MSDQFTYKHFLSPKHPPRPITEEEAGSAACDGQQRVKECSQTVFKTLKLAQTD